MFRSLVVAFIVVCLSSTVRAEVIVDWDLDGASGDQATQAPNSSAANVTGSDISRGIDLGASGAVNSFSSSGWNSDPAASPDLDTEYISLGFSVDPGYQVALDDLVIATRSSNTGPGTLGLYYSGDNFATTLFTFDQVDDNTLESTVNLGLNGLTGPIEFRFIEIGNTQADGGGATSSAGTFRLAESGGANITFNGLVSAVPEPSSVTVWLLSGLVFLRRRHRA
jgi:hypothetical protein